MLCRVGFELRAHRGAAPWSPRPRLRIDITGWALPVQQVHTGQGADHLRAFPTESETVAFDEKVDVAHQLSRTAPTVARASRNSDLWSSRAPARPEGSNLSAV